MRSPRPACSSARFAVCSHAWRVVASPVPGLGRPALARPALRRSRGVVPLEPLLGAARDAVMTALGEHQVRVGIRAVRAAAVNRQRIGQPLRAGQSARPLPAAGTRSTLWVRRTGPRCRAAHWRARARPPPPSIFRGRPRPSPACGRARCVLVPPGPARSAPRARCTRTLALADCPPARDPKPALR